MAKRLCPQLIRHRLLALIKTPLFWWITLWGNAFIVGGAIAIHLLESPLNPTIPSFLDSLSLAVGMVTTVGGGNVHPQSLLGKCLAMFMMMGGALFLWTYMALFVGALIDPVLSTIQREISEIQRDVQDEEQMLLRLKKIVAHLEKNQANKDLRV